MQTTEIDEKQDIGKKINSLFTEEIKDQNNSEDTETYLEIKYKLKNHKKVDFVCKKKSYLLTFLPLIMLISGAIILDIPSSFALEETKKALLEIELYRLIVGSILVSFGVVSFFYYFAEQSLLTLNSLDKPISDRQRDNIIKIASYNDEVKKLAFEPKTITKRMYQYYDIDGQLFIVSKIKSKSYLTEIINNKEYIELPKESKLSKVKVKYIPQDEMLKQVKLKTVFFVSINVALIINLIYSFYISTTTDYNLNILLFVLITIFSIISMIFYVKLSDIEKNRDSAFYDSFYKDLAELSKYNPKNKDYIRQVLKENRSFNVLDSQQINYTKQMDALEKDIKILK
jgi:hypothetical protein